MDSFKKRQKMNVKQAATEAGGPLLALAKSR